MRHFWEDESIVKLEFKSQEEQLVAMYCCDKLEDSRAKQLLTSGVLTSSSDARHLSQFFWKMVELSASQSIDLTIDGSPQYWVESLYNTLGGFIEQSGFASEWQDAIDHA